MRKSGSKRAKSKRRSATLSSEAAAAAAAVHAVRATAAGSYQIESIDQQHNTITMPVNPERERLHE